MRNLFVSMYVIVQTLFFCAWLFNYRPEWDLFIVLMPTAVPLAAFFLLAIIVWIAVVIVNLSGGKKNGR